MKYVLVSANILKPRLRDPGAVAADGDACQGIPGPGSHAT